MTARNPAQHYAVRRNARTMLRERGVAVITALLLTTMAVTIVASLFWQQQVQIRAIENQQLQLQKQWILRGALDWARLILSDDANNSGVDHFDEPWAAPFTTTQLGGYLENNRFESEASDSVLSVNIIDAQSRYNLANLVPEGVIDRKEIAHFQGFLKSLQLNHALAESIAGAMLSSAADNPDQSEPAASRPNTSGARLIRIEQLDDLLSVPGLSPEILEKLRDHVVILPHRTPINVNTASAQLLAAHMNSLSQKEIEALIGSRSQAYFRDNDVRLPSEITENPNNFSLMTNFFLVSGNVSVNRASLAVHALLERNPMIGSRTIWIRED